MIEDWARTTKRLKKQDLERAFSLCVTAESLFDSEYSLAMLASVV